MRVAFAVLCTVLVAGLAAQDTSETFDRELQELRDLSRGGDYFEVEFEPLLLDRVLIENRLGQGSVYHYLVFRIRNRVADSGDFLEKKYSHYNEVLDAIVKEHEGIEKDTSAGGALKLDSEREYDPIVSRPNLENRTRSLRLSALVTDDRGRPLRLLGPSEAPMVEEFTFDDRRKTRTDVAYLRVHRKVEELTDRKLLTTTQINQLEIPPYDAGKPSNFTDDDGEPIGFGMVQGEVVGVLIFDRLNVYANSFEVKIYGLSNKMRFNIPEKLPKGKVEDYYNMEILRRTYVLDYRRRGDEYFRDQDPFVLADHGYEWVRTFQRIDNKRDIALARYWLHNIRLERDQQRSHTFQIERTKEEDFSEAETVDITIQVPLLHDATIKSQLTDHYSDWIAAHPAHYDEKLAELEQHTDRIIGRYDGLEGGYFEEQLEAWRALLAEEREVIAEDKQLPPRVEEVEKALKE